MSFFKYNPYGDLEEKADKINLTKKKHVRKTTAG
jgi:hypothetical protein